MPRRPRTTKSIGLTTIPSPPAAVSSFHQPVARSMLSASVVSTATLVVACSSSSSAPTRRPIEVPGVRLVDMDGVLARE